VSGAENGKKKRFLKTVLVIDVIGFSVSPAAFVVGSPSLREF
jgi:hypothetical protein